MKKENFTIATSVSIFILLTLIIVLTGSNKAVFLLINRHISSLGQAFWINITNFGDGFVAFFLLLPFAVTNPKALTDYVIGGIVVAVVITVLKEFLGIPRPPQIISHDQFYIFGKTLFENSFPSGHSATIAVTVAAIILNTKRVYIQIIAILIMILVGISRIAVGAHWPVDVLSGFIIALSLMWTASVATQNIDKKIVRKIYNLVFAIAIPISVLVILFYKSEYPDAVVTQRLFVFAFFGYTLYLHRREKIVRENKNVTT